jgi:hypothetical protein
MVDIQLKLPGMKTSQLASLKREYERLRLRLADIGYISQGSVLDRSKLKSPRSGYQWTRKVARKTITVALSLQQYQGLAQAVANRKFLAKTVQQMEKISRKILFASLPDTRRTKKLGPKVLGLN